MGDLAKRTAALIDAEAASAMAGRRMLAGTLDQLVRARELRDRLFPAGLFGDPAWDMLLAVAAGDCADRPILTSSACQAGTTPQTTGLRHLARLIEAGLVTRRDDPGDARRKLVTLTPVGVELMARYAGELARRARPGRLRVRGLGPEAEIEMVGAGASA